MSWEHKEKIEKHASQKDYTSGFGGKFGVQKDRQDKSALGWDHVEKLQKHESQKGIQINLFGFVINISCIRLRTRLWW